MENYPGEGTDAPKKIVEALEKQPLSYLVPKSRLSSLLTDTMTVSVPLSHETFKESKDISNESHMIDKLNSVLLGIHNGDEESKLLFRRPKMFKYKLKRRDSADTGKLFEKLSPLAKQLLQLNDPGINPDDIINEINTEKSIEKHKLEDLSNISLDLTSQGSPKRAKLSSGVSLNQKSMGEQCLKELDILLHRFGEDALSSDRDDVEIWAFLDNDSYVLREEYIDRLQIVLNNIFTIPQIWPELKVEQLRRILDIMTNNIRICREHKNSKESPFPVGKIAYASVAVSFNVLSLNNNDKRLNLEQYVLEPIDFLVESLESIKNSGSSSSPVTDDLRLLEQSIQTFPTYIHQRPFLDESLVTKLTYLFTDIVMNYELELNSNIAAQNSWEKIKHVSSEALIALYNKVPGQRDFIIDELLSQSERLPQRRLQRKLRKVKKDLFTSDFTLTLCMMLENLNKLDLDFKQVDMIDSNFSIITEKQKEIETFLLNTIDHVNNTLLNQFFGNFIKYRHSLENYIQDLINLFPHLEWPVAELLLSSMMKKLLMMFGPNNSKAANAETVCLQLIGQIGCAIFDVRCRTRPNECNNLVKICNYPEYLQQFMASFDRCKNFLGQSEGKKSTYVYLCCSKLSCLVRLKEYVKDSEEQNSNIQAMIQQCLLDLESEKVDHVSSSDINDVSLDYFSVLHAYDLLNLYEPYLRLVLSILNQNKVKLRSTAIKCLSMLASKDKTVLSNSMVKATIVRLLSDSSAASIKDATLDLVSIASSYLQYFEQININYDNDSVLIRKHILKINERVYDETKDINTKIFVASKILLRLEDEEDTIIDMAEQILYSRWLTSVSELDKKPDRQGSICREIITVMSGIAVMSQKSSEIFDWFLNFYLLNGSLHTDDDFKIITTNLNKLTNTLVQEIVQLQSVDTNDPSLELTKEKYLNLLAKFAYANVSFITKDHIESLYPYMIADEKTNFLYHLLHVFRRSMEQLSNFKSKFLNDIETSILTRLPKMNVKEMEEAIPLAWQVACHRKDTTRIAKACSSCFIHMNPYINKANKDPASLTVDGKLQRLMYLATGFGSFCTFNANKDAISFLKNDETVYEYVAKCLLVLSRKDVAHIIRRIAIRNLTKLCGSHPKLFNSKHVLKLIDGVFEGDSLDIKLVVLESFYDFFIMEEQKAARSSGANLLSSSKAKSLNIKLLPKKKSDFLHDGICSALVSRYLRYILEICLLEDTKGALVSGRLLKLIVQYGYVNPSHCIPTVIALLSSKDKYMNHLVIGILTGIFEKHETMVFNGLSKGIQTAIEYSFKISGESFYENDIFIQALQSILGEGKKYTVKFSKYMNKILQIFFTNSVSINSDSKQKRNVLFLSTNIVNMKFSSQFEYLGLLKHIDFSAEQLQEIILDELVHESDENGRPNSKLKDAVIVHAALSDLQSYMLKLYGFKENILLYEAAQESDLKGKQMPLPKSTSPSFIEIMHRLLQSAINEQFYTKYIKNMQEY
ncbi:hypothetical protein KAFR_0B06100 [Kazachstania africana CBS 2517]|uniref:Sister chromatid cohesion protein n=1 Tax=Kazachstania africana (strain ATCC 22294 / BCRC 22015 / CBS 2517 / CECT 1963 / NBRC 1671 / NRRL Y-8276) TaxID=1071382 RepID=H2ARA6_KAZAF|nr:hypothetical protein KAFR_0B06100 [Kazachstania africana CBS 2517]CCF56906.1 hypothetical protein KAFR_0B06100 [Kazachstania africana CBS 2517]